MRTLFISDLHLDECSPDLTQAFIEFLETNTHGAESLYILGDLFETWVGDDQNRTFLIPIKSALKRATSNGRHIYIMPGNRDFLLGARFMKETGCQHINDPTLIHLSGQPTLLMHGDSLCLGDKSYMRFRRLTRNRLIQSLFLLLPLSFRQHLADKARKASREHTRQTPLPLQDIDETAMKACLQRHGATRLIHGHTHRPCIHYYDLTTQPKQRIVLSDWHLKGHYLSVEENGAYCLESL